MRQLLAKVPPRIALVAALGLTATLFTSHELAAREAFDASLNTVGVIVDDAVPSVIDLTELRVDVNELSDRMEHITRSRSDRAILRRDSAAILAIVDQRVRAYEALPSLPAERRVFAELDQDAADLRAATEQVLRANEPEKELDETLHPAARAIDRLAATLVEMNARDASRAAREIVDTHQSAKAHSLEFLVAVLACVLLLAVLAERWLARAEAETQRVIAELDAFAARVAHDLRGPLSPIALSLGLVKLDPGIGDRARHGVEVAETSLRRALNLIEGLLAFARSGARPPSDVRGSIDEAFDELRPALEEAAVAERAKLVFDVPPGLTVAASEVAVQSIVSNLTRNALYYLGEVEKREVTVRLREIGESVVIEVADTGPGIPPDVLKRLFRPFERASTRSGGHGLGLAIVRRLVESHGGTLGVRSEIGLGTTFEVRLPRP